MNSSIAFTLLPAPLTSNEGEHVTISWQEFLPFFSKPTVALNKERLDGWCPVRFKDNRRLLANVEEVSLIGLDDDHSGLPFERVRELWADFAGAVHTTHSHLEDSPRYRIILRPQGR